MANGFLNVVDSELLNWAGNFSRVIGDDAGAVGLTPQDAAGFAQRFEAFDTAMRANLPGVRSPVTAAEKEVARAALVGNAKLLVSRINGHPGVSDAQRVALGLVVRARPTKAAVPSEAPCLEVVGVRGHQVTIALSSLTGRGKSADAFAATLFYYVGETAPADAYDWRFCGNFGRTTIDVNFPESLAPGTKVWLAAQWMNTRLEPGPCAAGIYTHLQGGTVTPTGNIMTRTGRAMARAA